MLLYWLTRGIHVWLWKSVVIATPKKQAIFPCKRFAFNDGVNHKIHSVIVMLVNSNENSNNIVSILPHTYLFYHIHTTCLFYLFLLYS